MIRAEIDFETRSDIDLKRHGASVYFASPHARVLLGSYKIGGGPLRRWRYPDPCPDDLRAAIEGGADIHAHGAQFEYLCFRWLHETLDWPMPADDRFVCTAAMAAAMSLPRDLDSLGAALNLSIRKDKEGKRLINFFSIPRRPKKGEPPGLYFHEPEDHPEEFEKFHAYCDVDVLTESAADARMTSLSDYEQRVYALGEAINRRGIRIDRASAIAALRLAEKAKALYDREMRTVTEGAVGKCSEVQKIKDWCEAQGVIPPSLAAADISDALLDIDDMPDRVRRVLELRQSYAKTSVAKLEAMLRRAGDDSRVRGTFIYHGTGPGRFISVGVNFANLPRPRKEFEGLRLSTLFEAIRTEDPETLRLLYGPKLGDPMSLLADSLRSFIWAAPGHDLIQADYAGIQGAGIAWLADEGWKLKALFDIKADPALPDMYRRTASAILGIPLDVLTKKHPMRQAVGKTSELALGFQGGVSAFYAMARNYKMRMSELHALYPTVWASAVPEKREKASKRYDTCLKKRESQAHVLTKEAWLACEIVKMGWREANPKIRQCWYDYETAARNAVMNPGEVFTAARVSYLVKMGFLWARLPSGRCIAYGAPKLHSQVWASRLVDGEWLPSEVMDRGSAQMGERYGIIRIEGETSQKITVLGVIDNQLRRYPLYGGILSQNNTMGVERDILVHGMLAAERAGYPVIYHNYDEIVAEIPRGSGDLKAFEKLICELPDWAAGLPLTADGWRGKRYRKE